jgi:hypothetical protein
MAWYQEPPYTTGFDTTDIRLLNNNLLIALLGESGDVDGLAKESTLQDVLATLSYAGGGPAVTVAQAAQLTYSALYATSDGTPAADLLESIENDTGNISINTGNGSNHNNNANFVRGVAKNIITDAVTDLIAAPGAAQYNYITHILVTNQHASVGTLVDIQDETSGTVLYTGYAAPGGGGFTCALPTPLKQGATNKKVQVKCITTGANVTVSASGYKGA